jgi:hypothetical protein
MDTETLHPPGAMTFVVYNELFDERVMEILKRAGIDYYTRWPHVTGKGRGTEPHLGRGAYGSTNSVLMIAFQEETPLHALIDEIRAANAHTRRADDRIRLFQVPLVRIV